MTDERVEAVETFLRELDDWERAYPLSVFPEPDLKKAAALLKAGGMTLDSISASNMRHVVSRIAPSARAAISAMESMEPGEAWRSIESAPRDGTAFDAWCAPVGYDHGFRIADVIWEPRYSAFFSDDAGILANDLTHWQPLPAPPSTAVRENSNAQG